MESHADTQAGQGPCGEAQLEIHAAAVHLHLLIEIHHIELLGERIAAAVVSDAVRIEIAVFLLIGHAQFLMYALNADRRAEVEDIVDISAH